MEVVKITTDGFKMIAAMKKIFRTIIALVATASFASCAEEINNPVSDSGQNNAAGLVPMTFSSSADDSADSKTTYSAGKVCWEGTDRISVFSIGETGTPSESDFTVTDRTDDHTGARFEGLADPNASVYYAVYPYSESNACDAEGNLTVSIPKTQNAVADGFMPGANTSVAYSVEDADENILQFRNISTLLGISFATDADAAATKSVTIKAKKGENDFWGLSGKCTVKFSEDGIPVVGEGDVKSVTLVAPKDGFVKGVSYYIPVYAVGDVKGFEVTYLGQDDKNYVKTNNISASIGRNSLFNIGAIPEPYLPEVITFDVDFLNNKWPFNEGVVSKDFQVETGETYTYTYSYNVKDVSFVKNLPFVVRRGCDSSVIDYYECTDKGLCFVDCVGKQQNSDYGAIMFPAIYGRYLSRVDAYLTSKDSKTAKRVYLTTTRITAGCVLYTTHSNSAISPNQSGAYHVVYELPIVDGANSAYAYGADGDTLYTTTDNKGGSIEPLINTAYLLRMRQTGLYVEKVTLKFTNIKPSTE